MDEKVIRVFISSTFEDLEEERKAAYTAIFETNPTLSTNKIVLLPVDMRHGASSEPPLEECLKEVTASQVLIGLIGTKYGTVDPQTGKSFSELEYDEAKKCAIPTLMYFREAEYVKPEWVETDSDKKAKLEAFKRKIDCRRDIFKFYEQLRGNIIRDLPCEVLKKYPQPEGKEIESPEKPAAESADEVVLKKKARVREINQLFKSISSNLSDLTQVDSHSRRRLFLLATSLFYDTELSGALETHEVQMLYCERKNMSLLRGEIFLLMKSVFADVYENKAGWFWVKSVKSRDILYLLEWLCMKERDEDISIGCLQLLKHFWSDETGTIIVSNVSSDKKKVRLEALKILEELASEKCLDILEKAATDQDIDIQRGARRAKLAILARYDPSKAASYIEEFENEYATGSGSALSEIMPKLKVDGLRKLKEHKDEKIKQLAVVELAKRGELDENELDVLINDGDVQLRYWGYYTLIDKGKKFDVAEIRKNWPNQRRYMPYTPSLLGSFFTHVEVNRLNELIVKILKTYSIEGLTKSLTWLDPDSEFIYLALGLCKGREILGQVRDDLDNKFARIKDAYKAEINELKIQSEKINDQASLNKIQGLIDAFDKTTIYGENVFTKSALKILMEHGEQEDMRFAKQFMVCDESEIKELATKLFVNLAGENELSALVETALNNTGEIKEKAALKALAIDKEGSVLEAFMESNNSVLIKLYFKEKLKKGKLLEKVKIEQLLLNANEDIREITVAYLMKALRKRRAKLEQILDKYLENQTYYYNTVCWLDRILYAPLKFRELYRKQLSAKLDE